MPTATPWSNDRLDREADGKHLISVLLERYASRVAQGNGSYILNVDAAWGEGKTYFLQNLRADLEARNHLVAYVNAWEDDHTNDPLITVMSAIDEVISPLLPVQSEGGKSFAQGKKVLGIVAAETAKQITFHALKSLTGIAVSATIETLNDSGALIEKYSLDESAFDKGAEEVWKKGLESFVGDRLKEQQAAKSAISEFRIHIGDAISQIIRDNGVAPVFVFVDELDRCRPTYAIRLLEDLKHLFSIQGIVFVVATDTRQLSHSVKAVYGAEFEAQTYLRRFFDRTFVFPDRSKARLVANLFETAGIDPSAVFFSFGGVDPRVHLTLWAEGLKVSNRDLAQIFEVLTTFVTSFEHNVQIEINYLLALVWAFYDAEPLKFSQLSAGIFSSDGIFDQWKIRHIEREPGTGRLIPVDTPAQSVLSTLTTMARVPLHKITGNGNSPSYKNYFDHELVCRFPILGSAHDIALSLLFEYPSRVRNAGRVLDRDAV
jgi:hypothetical protein